MIPVETEEARSDLILSDEALDNDCFIDISFGGVWATVSLNDLMPAIIAFECKRSKRLSEEEHMS